MAQFGKRVFYRPLGIGDARSAPAINVLPGHFVGYHQRTGALLIMAHACVFRSQGFKRPPRAQARAVDNLGHLKGFAVA
eukprot:7614452-Pyramimonas_sp.AAC.1